MKKIKKEATRKKSTRRKKKQPKKQKKQIAKKLLKSQKVVVVPVPDVVLSPPPEAATLRPVRRRKLNYLNNRDILFQVALSKTQGKMSNELALMLHTLCARYARRGNFCNYTYNDDMQAYALLMLVKTWHSFNPEKSNNPFAFFTQCIKHSFIQYLNQEKRQRDVRDSIMVQNGMTPSFAYMADNADRDDEQEPTDFTNDKVSFDVDGDSSPVAPTEEEDAADYEPNHNDAEVDLDTHDEGITNEHLHED